MARHVVTRALPGFTLPPMELPQSRIKDPALADLLTAEELEWQAEIMPVTEAYRRALAGRDYRGRTVACWQHITPDFIAVASALTGAGASIVMGACNVDSTDDRAAAYLSRMGVSVLAWSGMSDAEYREHLEIVSGCGAEFLSDMGGELIEAAAAKGNPITGALEATTTGIHRLDGLDLGFPVFDWNDIRLKDGLHNRFHVGDAVWPAFEKITGMSLFGRRVLVIGFGPVGRGVAQRAISLGARVSVAERDPVRLLEAQHFGCETVSLAEGLAACQIVVTATGVSDVLCEAELRRARPGTLLFNVGHLNREIDIDWLYGHPHRTVIDNIERIDLGDSHLFLLGRGSLLNLAGDAAHFGRDLFEIYTALMLRGISWMFDGGCEGRPAGMQPFPIELEREIAALTVRARAGETLEAPTL